VLMLSAWFHDSGYVANGGGLEKSIEIARDFLARQKQPGSLADAVADCLKDTADGEAREGRVRDVLHDALLAPLASKSYIEDAQLLRLEEEGRIGKSFSDVEWTQGLIGYFHSHAYRTRWAQLEYEGGRAKNLVRLHKLLRSHGKSRASRKRREPRPRRASAGWSRASSAI